MQTQRKEIEIYNRADLYEMLNGDDRLDIDFYLKEANKLQGPILELACGTGILCLPIAAAGIKIIGLDLSPQMISYA